MEKGQAPHPVITEARALVENQGDAEPDRSLL